MTTPTVLFIAGLGRSGTTLLEQALGQHRDIVVLGETLHLWKRGLLLDECCGCGEPFSRCEFWYDIGKRAFGGWDAVDPHRVLELRRRIDRVRRVGMLSRATLPRRDAAAVREYAEYFRALHDAAAELTGAPVVVDSSKQVSLAFCLSHLVGADLRVLHCVRDSRAVAYSWSTVVPRPDSTTGSQMDRYHPLVAALKWDWHNMAVPMLDRRSVPWCRLRYEDFADNPQQAIADAASFAGVEPDRFDPDRIGPAWLHLEPAHTVSGNPVRFRSGWVEVQRDERWRGSLPNWQRTLVTAVTWPLLLRYGYRLKGMR